MKKTLLGRIIFFRGLFVWNTLYYMTIMAFMSCGLICCDDENDPRQNPLTGDQVLVHFSLIEETPQGNKTLTPVTERKGQEIAVIPIEGDLNMYARLEIDQEIETRASSPLAIDKRVRIVAYRIGIADTTYVTHVDYKMTSSGLIPESGPGMSLTRNVLYLFVAYSYNKDVTMDNHNTALTADAGLFFDLSAQSPFDLSWGSTTQYLSSVTHTVQVSMSHLFAKVKVQATTGTSGAAISSISNLTIPSYKFDFHIRTGKVTPDLSGIPPAVQIPVTNWTGLGTNLITSDSVFTYYFDPATPLEIGSMTIGGVSYSAGYSTSFGPLLPGYSYTLHITFRRTPFINIYWYQGTSIDGGGWGVSPRLTVSDIALFGWSAADAEFDVVSNDGCLFDAASSTLHGGFLTPGTPFVQNGDNVYPYRFTFNNTNYLTIYNYALKFTTNSLSADVTLQFKRGIQEWSNNTAAIPVGYKGFATTAPVQVIYNHNLIYTWWFDNWMLGGVAGGGSSWAKSQTSTQPSIPFNTPLLAGNMWTGMTYLGAFGYSGPYPSPNVMKGPDTMKFAVDAAPGPILNVPSGDPTTTRSVQFHFRNNYPTTGITPLPDSIITITQYRPRIYLVNQAAGSPTLSRWPTFTSTGMIPQAGTTFTFNVSTNLTGWGIRVYGSSSSWIVSQAGTPAVNDQTGSNISISVTIPASTEFRVLSFYFYSTETGLTTPEIKFAEVIQDGSLIAETGDAATRIFIQGSGDNARLMLTKKIDNFGSYFQYGGIMGWAYHGASGNASYNPSISGSSALSNGWNIGSGFGVVVPHTNASLRTGVGDPCKLLGFTVAQIREALNNGNAPDNKKYRTPMQSENEAWANTGYFSSYTSVSTPSGSIYGRWFGPSSGGISGNREFLPANGYGYYTGASSNPWSWTSLGDNSVSGQSGSGGYWVGQLCGTHGQSHGLIFSNGSNNPSVHSNMNQHTLMGVRCVAQ